MSYTSELRRTLERMQAELNGAAFGAGDGDILVVGGPDGAKVVGLLDATGVADGWVLTRDSASPLGVKWEAPSGGGGGTSNHAALSNLGWGVSGHTGAASTLAGFSGAGASTTYGLPLAVAQGGTGGTTQATARAGLGLAIGTDVQAQDPQLQALANLAPSADQIAYWTSGSSAALADLTPYARTLLDDIDASTARGTLGAADASLGYVTWQSEPDLPGHRALSAQELIEIQLTTDEAQVRVRFGATQRLAGRNTAGAGAGEELTVHQALDWVTTTRGALLFRGSAEWQPRIPVAAVGHVLTNQGVGADPTWASISTALDVLSSIRGAVLYRGASSWLALAPGTAGHVLTTQGAGADPSWQAAGGGGGGLSQAQILSRASLRA